jgi:hypothetical protein
MPVVVGLQEVGGNGAAKHANAWVFSPGDGHSVSMRFVGERQASAPPSEIDVEDLVVTPNKPFVVETWAAPTEGRPACDLADAIGFGLRYAAARADSERITLDSSVCADAHAACDRQTARRIARHLIESAMDQVPTRGTVRVDARRLKSIVLVRATTEVEPEDEEAMAGAKAGDHATLRSLVEEAGGTLVVDRAPGRLVLSVRLDAAEVATAERVTPGA